MLNPKRKIYRKPYRSYLKSIAYYGNNISFGEYGIQNIKTCWITARQIESSRRVLTRYVRRVGKLWIRIFPEKTITKRPAETRIGSGKGIIDYWVAVVNSGTIIFEIQGIPNIFARKAISIAASKLPTKIRFLVKL